MSLAVTLDTPRDEAQATESALAQILETALHVGEGARRNREVADLLTNDFIQEARTIIPLVLQAYEGAWRRWDALCSIGRAGRADEVHALRGSFLKSIEAKLQMVERARRMAETFVVLTEETLPESARLASAEEKLRRFHKEVFGKWHTLDDLEAMLAASFPLSQDKLETIGQKHRPPAAWYLEEGKPF